MESLMPSSLAQAVSTSSISSIAHASCLFSPGRQRASTTLPHSALSYPCLTPTAKVATTSLPRSVPLSLPRCELCLRQMRARFLAEPHSILFRSVPLDVDCCIPLFSSVFLGFWLRSTAHQLRFDPDIAFFFSLLLREVPGREVN